MNLNLTGEGKVKFIENRDLFSSARVIFDTRTDDEERTKWLETRVNSIGGSEIGSIAGFNKYGSALTVFNDKLGLGKKFEWNIHTLFGNRMEPHIREWIQEDFEKATNIRLKTFEYPFMMVDKEIEYFSANIDGIGMFEDNYTYWENRDTGEIKYIPANELFGLEIKTGSEFLKKMWAGEEIPDSYYCQCQWYMGVTGLQYFLIIYLLGKEVKWKVVPRNDDDIKALREIGKDFWENNILTETPPDPTGNSKETEDINYQQNLKDEDEVNISKNKLARYSQISDEIKALETQKEKLKQEIFLEMGNSKKGSDGLFKISRFEVKRDSLDNKTLKEKYPSTYAAVLKGQTEYVNLRISKCK
ncbi:YqaJ viral recombinase family protein [Clostridium beijerinckii]|uniref:YqaJ viral recombinase family nuclease n=1 Tax=Clostridium beijerinckii TaxID=1520 RepID=UPI00136159C4|nr:YqaJ viral recombinase family protein [Clostridium beijerinckii]MZK53494.1 endonuclease [Clostridium beijerinckii]MZK61632.1 endonuclease [Clostridium beijerinckii]MZK71857.1 endonuclease [Clostridium beijerinckii]MZK77261.1 endonuclease [Clostridium beijerinckii]MZK86340.1 endonuclease [Clostridium beijerinckii]